MGKVHLDCLNQWRAMSVNPQSFYQCDQCGYKYNVQRAEIATLLEKPAFVQVRVRGRVRVMEGVKVRISASLRLSPRKMGMLLTEPSWG